MIGGTVRVKSDDSVRQMLTLLKDRRPMGTIAQFLIRGVEQANQELVGLIQKERLNGQGPYPVSQKRLGIVTNRLYKSFRAGQPKFRNGVISTWFGSNVKYFGRHEFGGSGRQIRVGAAKVKAHKRRNAFGRGKTVEVPAHTRKAYLKSDTMPKREPVQAGLREHGTRIYGITIEKQLMRALEGRFS